MLRDVITINEELCDGCGECVTSCVEGALQLINGKAKLISEMYCDGLGACIGNCPQNAITVIKKECEAYSEIKTLENIIPQGEAVLVAHLKHLFMHGQKTYLQEAFDYLGEQGIEIDREQVTKVEKPVVQTPVRKVQTEIAACACNESEPAESELQNWPVQMHLANPLSDSFRNKDLLIAADCVPFAYRNFHQDLLKDKAVLIACPKLDNNKEAYLNKLITLFTDNKVKSVTVAVMEVPCCSGLVHLVKQALEYSGAEIPFIYKVVGIEGSILN
ncbi:MAG: 4Fe-4S binding protein [Ignavibacteria bacterium]|nr:4Fe-4S binding protein [Ignavibacteria bacterium]